MSARGRPEHPKSRTKRSNQCTNTHDNKKAEFESVLMTRDILARSFRDVSTEDRTMEQSVVDFT